MVVDVADRSNPKLIVHKSWFPPLSGGTHNALPLPDRNLLIVVDEAVLDNEEDGRKYIWVFDNQIKSNPISISTFPIPQDRDYKALGGHFGPHNIYENRPNGFQSRNAVWTRLRSTSDVIGWRDVAEEGIATHPPALKQQDDEPDAGQSSGAAQSPPIPHPRPATFNPGPTPSTANPSTIAP